ncbi:c-type cytochrome biogenesis protein CcmI [Candidatus Venteria ishoeyi]|uniref:Cytochrome c-type biogenesis protein CcmH n=1 Tax=Candidatus Venteria ishoeyi TaxID=1899563 RepID=A0A1H6FE14_9GAMM|nr:c-type cytochrome biogenesis protein CcmI [Candidatus Venteria ishoeyi]SEH07651.1 Cytochrome c-type biogenesis protein CcmH precursor [Candidatus Venteria ishoeyi]
MTFWLIVAALIAVSLAFVLPSLLKKNLTLHTVDRNEANLSIYNERLVELENSDLNPEQLVLAKQELEKNLLEDMSEDTAPVNTQARGHWAAIVVAVFLPLLALGIYSQYGHFPKQNGSENLAHNAGNPASAQQQVPSLEEMLVKLEERMQQQPDDLKGWEMLGRTYRALERFDDAEKALAKAVELSQEQNADILVEYAEILALTQGDKLSGVPKQWLDKALKLDAGHHKALWLSGWAAIEAEDYSATMRSWEHLLSKLPIDSDAYQNVATQLSEVRTKVGMAPVVATEQVASAPAQATEEKPAATTLAVQLQVQAGLAPALLAQTTPEDTVFIYARAAQGPKMPLAAVKKQVKDLPVTVALDDSMAMMPTMKLSGFTQVVVGARISKSGNAISQSGDLLGESAALNPSEHKETVQIQIAQQIP